MDAPEQPPTVIESPRTQGAWIRFAPLLASLLALLPHLRILTGSRELFHDDHFRFTVPLAKLVAEALREGRLPLWNPWILTGTPLVAERGGMIIHPGMWLAFLFEPSHAVGVLMVLFLAVLAFGTTALLRELGVGALFSVAAGVAASLVGPALSYASNAPFLATLAFYPLTLYAAVRLGRTGQGMLVGGFSLGMAIMGGDLPGAALLGLIAVIVFVVASDGSGGLKSLLGVLLIALVLGIGAWYPVVWALPVSERGAGIAATEAGRWSFHPFEWMGFVWPHPMGLPLPEFSFWPFHWLKTERLFLHSVWIGALSTVAAFSSLFRGGDRLSRVFTLSSLVLLLVAMGEFSPAWSLLRPLFTFLRYPSKMAAPAAMLLFLAGALSLWRMASQPRILARVVTVAVGVGLVGALVGPLVIRALAARHDVPGDVVALACTELRAGSFRVAMLSLLVFLVALLVARGRIAARILVPLLSLAWLLDVGLGTADVMWSRPPMALERPGYLPASDRRGPRVMRLAEVGKTRLARTIAGFSEEQARQAFLGMPMVNAPEHIGMMEPYGMYPGDLGKAMVAVNERDPVWTAELLGTDVLLTSPTASAPWIRQAVESRRLIPKHRLTAAGAIAMILPDSLPRSYLAFQATLDSRENVRRRLVAGEGREAPLLVRDAHLFGGRLVPQTVDWSMPAGAEGAIEPVTPELWRAGESRYRLATERDALLVELETFLPGWRAYVDGKEVPIVEANLMTRAIQVPKGNHTVEFRFGTAALVGSIIVSWMALAAILVAAVFRVVRVRLRR